MVLNISEWTCLIGSSDTMWFVDVSTGQGKIKSPFLVLLGNLKQEFVIRYFSVIYMFSCIYLFDDMLTNSHSSQSQQSNVV